MFESYSTVAKVNQGVRGETRAAAPLRLLRSPRSDQFAALSPSPHRPLGYAARTRLMVPVPDATGAPIDWRQAALLLPILGLPYKASARGFCSPPPFPCRASAVRSRTRAP